MKDRGLYLYSPNNDIWTLTLVKPHNINTFQNVSYSCHVDADIKRILQIVEETSKLVCFHVEYK